MSGKHCCFPQCDGRKLGRPTFGVPLTDPRRQMWIDVIKIAKNDPNWIPAKTSRVCAGHFTPAQVLTGLGRTASRLLPSAIPLLNTLGTELSGNDHQALPLLALPTEQVPGSSAISSKRAPKKTARELFPELPTNKITLSISANAELLKTYPASSKSATNVITLQPTLVTPKRVPKRLYSEVFSPLTKDIFTSPPSAITPKRTRYDHSYSLKASPATHSKKLAELLKRAQAKLKSIQRWRLRAKKRIFKLKDIIREYRKAGGDDNSCDFLLREESSYFNIDPVINTRFYNNCLAYIAGSAIKAILPNIMCPDCAFSLVDSSSDPLDDDLKKLINKKDRGGLHCPSNSVYQLVKLTDSIFRSKIREAGIVPTTVNFDLKILKLVQEASISLELFPELDSHVHQMEFSKSQTTSHFVHLLRTVVKQFLKIRLYDYGKRFNRNMGVSGRHERNKLTLFRHE